VWTKGAPFRLYGASDAHHGFSGATLMCPLPQSSSSYVTWGYDNQSRLDYVSVLNDDASSSFTGYDQANGAAWSYVTLSYDPSGHLQTTFVQNDDGSFWFV
jgi:hypothetical protein